MTQPTPEVQRAAEKTGEHMTAILGLFKPGAKILVVVHRAGHPDQDFILTNGSLDEAVEAIRRRQADPKSVAGHTG